MGSMTVQVTLIDFIDRHPRLFVLTGAGCSTDSGIPDYRDAEGEWKRRPADHVPGLRRQRARAQALLGEESRRLPPHARCTPERGASLAGAPRAPRADRAARHAERRRAAPGGRQSQRDRSARPHRRRALPELRSAHVARAAAVDLVRRNPEFAALDAVEAPDGDADLEAVDVRDLRCARVRCLRRAAQARRRVLRRERACGTRSPRRWRRSSARTRCWSWARR